MYLGSEFVSKACLCTYLSCSFSEEDDCFLCEQNILKIIGIGLSVFIVLVIFMKLFSRLFKNIQESNQTTSQTHLENGQRRMPNHQRTTLRNSNSHYQPSAPPISYISQNWNDQERSMVPNGQLTEDLPPTYQEAISSKGYKNNDFM